MIDEKRLAEIRERKIPQRFAVTLTHALLPDSSGRWCDAIEDLKKARWYIEREIQKRESVRSED